jgi:YggT family protein
LAPARPPRRPIDTLASRLAAPYLRCASPARGQHQNEDDGGPMIAVYNLINTVISIYIWLLIAMVVLNLLVSFNMVNTGNRFIYTIGDFLNRITEPLLRPIRNILPNLGGIDISPIVLILALYFIRDLAFQFLVL